MNKKMRIYHRYLGFFLAGIMAVYALSGIVLIFRETKVFTYETQIEKTLPNTTTIDELGKALGLKRFKIEKTDGDLVYFKEGTYNSLTHEAKYEVKEYPIMLDKLNKLHKATTGSPLFFLNIFFGLALLFFVISTFWMFLPGTKIFKKGMYFTIGGIILTVLMLFV